MLKSGPSSLPCLCWEITPQREDETVLMLPSGPADVIPARKTAIIALANRARDVYKRQAFGWTPCACPP